MPVSWCSCSSSRNLVMVASSSCNWMSQIFKWADSRGARIADVPYRHLVVPWFVSIDRCSAQRWPFRLQRCTPSPPFRRAMLFQRPTWNRPHAKSASLPSVAPDTLESISRTLFDALAPVPTCVWWLARISCCPAQPFDRHKYDRHPVRQHDPLELFHRLVVTLLYDSADLMLWMSSMQCSCGANSSQAVLDSLESLFEKNLQWLRRGKKKSN